MSESSLPKGSSSKSSFGSLTSALGHAARTLMRIYPSLSLEGAPFGILAAAAIVGAICGALIFALRPFGGLTRRTRTAAESLLPLVLSGADPQWLGF